MAVVGLELLPQFRSEMNELMVMHARDTRGLGFGYKGVRIWGLRKPPCS